MTTNTSITVVIIGGLALIAYLFYAAPALAPGLLPIVLVGVGTLIKQFDSDKKAADTNTKLDQTTAKVDRSISVSTENAHAIAAVAVQQSHAIEQVSQQVDTTHAAVNGQMSEFRKALEQVSAMKEEQSSVLAELVAARSELAVANARAGGITTGRGQAAATIAASDAARAGEP